MSRRLLLLAAVGACDGDRIDVTWSFVSVASGEPTTCPVGFPIAEVYLTKWYFSYGSEASGGWDWSPGVRRLYAIADCEDGGATTMELPYIDWADKGRDFDVAYDVDVSFKNDDGELWGTSLGSFQSLDRGKRGAEPVHLEVAVGGGQFSFTYRRGWWWWCGGAGNEQGAIRISLDAADGVRSEMFSCRGVFAWGGHGATPGWLYTSVYPAGDYRIWIDGLDSEFQVRKTWMSDGPVTLGPNNDLHHLAIDTRDVTMLD